MVRSVLFSMIFFLVGFYSLLYGQITLDMPSNFTHLQARNGHKALIYEDSTQELSIEFRYGFPKKYKDYTVLKLSQAIQATIDSNWTDAPPSIEVNFGEIAIHYDLRGKQIGNIINAFNLYQYPNYDSARAFKAFYSLPASPDGTIIKVDSTYTFPFSEKSNVHAKLFRSIFIQTPSLDSSLSSIVEALELLPEVSPIKNRSYAKDGQLEFNTMEVYPSTRDSITFCYAGPHSNNVTKYHAALLVLQEYLMQQPNDSLGQLSISYIGGQSYLKFTYYDLEDNVLDSLINHKVEHSVFSAEVEPLTWDSVLIDSIKNYILNDLESQSKARLKDQLAFFDNEWAIYLPAELRQVNEESMQRMINIFVNNMPFYVRHCSIKATEKNWINQDVFDSIVKPTVNLYDSVENHEVFSDINSFLQINPLYNVSMVLEIGNKEIKWVKDTAAVNYLLNYPYNLAAANQLKRIRRKYLPMGVARGLTYFQYFTNTLNLAPKRVRFNVIRLEKGYDRPLLRFNLSQSF
ncbi:MAG TPA: hypothetical protein DCF84_00280 [Bacteroidetes bacterium]|nr:hypothetical protein [Bacteroidota bacterium]